MALVLRSHSDLVYVPDHGYAGVPGAINILLLVKSHIHRLDVSHNLLGQDGTHALFRGLAELKTQYSAAAVWGLREVNLGSNGIDDSGLDTVLWYARKDLGLKKVLVQGNSIKLRSNVESLAHSINTSRISELSLTNNPISPSSLTRFLSLLSAPHLSSLHLSACSLPRSVAVSFASLLTSSRSRGLQSLELNANRFGADGVRIVVDAIERGNYEVVRVEMYANEIGCVGPQAGRWRGAADNEGDSEDGESEEEEEQEEQEEGNGLGAQGTYVTSSETEGATLAYELADRLPLILARNIELTKRVRIAAARALAPCRILLLAQPPDPQTEAARVISALGTPSGTEHTSFHDSGSLAQSQSPKSNGKTHLTFPEPTLTSPSLSHFRLLDLPPELVLLIARHCSGDAYALSETQWARLRTIASDRDGLRKDAERAKAAGLGGRRTSASAREVLMDREVEREKRNAERRKEREAWLKKGKWDRWELDSRGW